MKPDAARYSGLRRFILLAHGYCFKLLTLPSLALISRTLQFDISVQLEVDSNLDGMIDSTIVVTWDELDIG